ncbi:UDP-glucose/GDP-mannose dehydrogenase family protein [Salipaludibacillus agaradhaerens]|uniref:UDP-glucose 6-dehydrogenase n=1 Tax=Salipaludibacillus agaradhaerens TaxID=76935 RepID=A0A9Q4FXS0_SALAG|nr:UDP-glucose/GDP-mannose dehydrogenase family protein [Salipaludibacillus agaradhaerens]MCR6094968.1 UDP-glucose/GDP-mannose dehydrogenase family protein [Salipaludibacillus agaradhaerens]MCR6115474.1 UDP-glucose/GDP-mannose dehydrogenase family protein [Salipaludibacillus agaradhaerens]
MKKIAVVGTGYVGLVTGVALSDIGHDVTCIDIDEHKVKRMQEGKSPIYEPGLDEVMARNIEAGRLHFTTSHEEGFNSKDVIYIAVGTPEKEDGTADLRFIDQVTADIATHVADDVIIVTKSTVPVGTNDYILKKIRERLIHKVTVNIVSNPEFLREGSAVYDAFHGDRIVVGADSKEAGDVIEDINKPFGIQVYRTDVRSAEMIKYASNAFLATKISFINEIANICEKVGANIEDVATGMGMDDRIGSKFLNAGIGYGGSCFPKDTKALAQIAANNDHHFELLESVIRVNNQQHSSLTTKAKTVMGSLKGKKVALLGLAFKPNTDDMRESPAIAVSSELLLAGADVTAYDPIAMDNAKKVIPEGVTYVDSTEEALAGADAVFIITDWPEFKELDLSVFKEKMATPLLFDGRNCYDLNTVASANINYYSIGRSPVENGDIKTIS